jgi:hypothetical protein
MQYRTMSLIAGLCLIVGCAVGLEAQAPQARLMGTVLDESSGALPGVTVTVQPRSGAPIVVYTDGSGRYLTPWLPPGIYTISFALSGFETKSVANIPVGDSQTIVLDQKLALAGFGETVEVVAPKPPEPKKPVRPKTVPVEKEILAPVCGPREAPAFSLSVGHIQPGDDHGRELFGPGDMLNIDAGEQQGITVGQNLVIKRRFQTDLSVPKKMALFGEQAAGLAQIVATRASSSTAMLVYVCGEVFAGDVVERYAPQPAFFTVVDGEPHFDDPAKITIGENNQMAASEGQLIVIDRGIMKGVQRGQRLTIFRRKAGDAPPITIGDGLVIATRADSATVRIERSTDAVMIGDLVAIHR